MSSTRLLAKGSGLAAAQDRNGSAESSSFDRFLTRLLDTTERAARWRRFFTWLIFWIFIIVLAWRDNPQGWIDHFRKIFLSFFIDKDAVNTIVSAFSLLGFAIQALIAPDVLKHILVVLGPFLLAWQIAAVYLQDIFELEHTGIARDYIMQSALASEYDHITIRSGTIDLKNTESPLIQIGGPGRIQVELDSAALFEKVDGSCRVIGPTVEGRHYKFLEGFERIREVIDLRDLSTDSMTNSSRSRDGIQVVAKDVRLVYSVQRGNQKETLEKPFPFIDEAIRQLVFQETTLVTPGQPKIVSREDYWKQTYKRWSGTMPGLIQGALSDFVGEHNLSEFLANIGQIELDALKRIEAENRQSSESMAASGEPPTASEIELDAPDFTPRTEITNLFYDFASGFPKKAENRGVQLTWIGVGTWGTPASADLISKNHLEAWRISRENYLRGHPQALANIREDACLQEMQNLIQSVVLSTFKDARQQDLPAQEIAHKILTAYREQLGAGWELYERDRKNSPDAVETPPSLIEALRMINGLLAHYVN